MCSTLNTEIFSKYCFSSDGIGWGKTYTIITFSLSRMSVPRVRGKPRGLSYHWEAVPFESQNLCLPGQVSSPPASLPGVTHTCAFSLPLRWLPSARTIWPCTIQGLIMERHWYQSQAPGSPGFHSSLISAVLQSLLSERKVRISTACLMPYQADLREVFFLDHRKFSVTKIFPWLRKQSPYCKQYLIQQNYNRKKKDTYYLLDLPLSIRNL